MPEFYSRRTSGLPPSVLENALPLFQLGRAIKADKRAEEDYGLKKQYEAEDRAAAAEARRLGLEDRAFNRERLLESDRIAEQQRNLAAERYEDEYGLKLKAESRMSERDKLEDAYRNKTLALNEKIANAKQADPLFATRMSERDKLEDAYRNKTLALNEKIANAKQADPLFATELEIYRDTHKAYYDALTAGDEEGAKKIGEELKAMSDRLKQYGKQPDTIDPNMGLKNVPGSNPIQDRIREADALGLDRKISLPLVTAGKPFPSVKKTDAPSVLKLQSLVEANKGSGNVSVPENKPISEDEIRAVMINFRTDRQGAIDYLQKKKDEELRRQQESTQLGIGLKRGLSDLGRKIKTGVRNILDER